MLVNRGAYIRGGLYSGGAYIRWRGGLYSGFYGIWAYHLLLIFTLEAFAVFFGICHTMLSLRFDLTMGQSAFEKHFCST